MYNVTMEPYLSTSFKNVCGLYKISIGPKFYYGSSKNLYNRAYQHIPEKTMHDWLRLPNRPRKSYKKYNFSYVGVI